MSAKTFTPSEEDLDPANDADPTTLMDAPALADDDY